MSIFRALAALPLLIATAAHAIDVDGSFRLLNRFNAVHDAVQTYLVYDQVAHRFRVEEYLLPNIDHIFSTHLIGGFVDVNFGSGWSFTASVDSGLVRVGEENLTQPVPFRVGTRTLIAPVPILDTRIGVTANGNRLVDEALRSLFIREAYFTYSADRWIHAYAGKRRVVLADGWLYDQFTFAAGLVLDSSHRSTPSKWRLELQVLVADGSFDTGGKHSPLAHLGIYYVPGRFQHFGLEFFYLHDGNDLFNQIIQTALSEGTIDRAQTLGTVNNPALALQLPLASSGDVLWIGVSGKRFLGDHTIQGRILAQLGSIDISVVFPSGGPGNTPLVREITPRALGMLADFFYKYDVTEDFVVGAFFTFATGDDDISESLRRGDNKASIDTFLSIFPFVSRTNLFFNGGLNSEFSLRQASTVGVSGRGLVMGGAFARFEPGRSGLSLEGKVAALSSHRRSIYDGHYYGTEIDLTFQAPLMRGVRLVTEADALFTGSFFARARTSLQFIVGIDVGLP